ncbi:ABC transporter ATP-binding protein [Thermorudis peleae]|uniref:ABC transporter ATP-binding protein n=1 Tax=Thermorudis peleae TaxID=1382356 RepID=UPI0006912AA5|nr:ABC transporter ATP-binding protein [Thermorudis peleae]
MTTVRSSPVLHLDQLTVDYRVDGEWRLALTNISLSIAPGETYGLVGESGSGKTTLAAAVAGFLPKNSRIRGGHIYVLDHDVTRYSRREWQRLWRHTLAVVFQNPGASLNPALRIQTQLAESFRAAGLTGPDVYASMISLLEQLRLRDPKRVLTSYPHQLSGGMQQRVAIAIALARQPSLLILDEPTTGLDATVAADVLELISELQTQYRTAILFISHDLHAVARTCNRVGVLYAGRLVEEGPVQEIVNHPSHPYTVSLLRCLPRFGMRKTQQQLLSLPGDPIAAWQVLQGCAFASRCYAAAPLCADQSPAAHFVSREHYSVCHFAPHLPPPPVNSRTASTQQPSLPSPSHKTAPLLTLERVRKTYERQGHKTLAVNHVSFSLAAGETIGLIGESGSGKSTLARIIVGLQSPDAGSRLVFDGQPLADRVRQRSASQRQRVQLIFQNPELVLNPRRRIGDILHRAIVKLGSQRGAAAHAAVRSLAQQVQFPLHLLQARPAAISGGLKQRAAIAHGLAGHPQLLVLDEPTSSLDVSTQAAILNLLVDLQQQTSMAYLFISHDLALVHYIADRIIVLFAGSVMECIPADYLFDAPLHPYTAALLTSGLRQNVAIRASEHQALTLTPSPEGCPYVQQCPLAIPGICDQQFPPCQEPQRNHQIFCHAPLEHLPRITRVAESENSITLIFPHANER